MPGGTLYYFSFLLLVFQSSAVVVKSSPSSSFAYVVHSLGLVYVLLVSAWAECSGGRALSVVDIRVSTPKVVLQGQPLTRIALSPDGYLLAGIQTVKSATKVRARVMLCAPLSPHPTCPSLCNDIWPP